MGKKVDSFAQSVEEGRRRYDAITSRPLNPENAQVSQEYWRRTETGLWLYTWTGSEEDLKCAREGNAFYTLDAVDLPKPKVRPAPRVEVTEQMEIKVHHTDGSVEKMGMKQILEEAAADLLDKSTSRNSMINTALILQIIMLKGQIEGLRNSVLELQGNPR